MKTVIAAIGAVAALAMPIAADAETFNFNFAFEQVVGGIPQGTGYTAAGILTANAVGGLYTVTVATGSIVNTFNDSTQAIGSVSGADGLTPATFRLDGATITFADINFDFYSFVASIAPGVSSGFAVEAAGPLTAASITPAMAGSVPEPASWALMIAGVAAAGGALRRRRGRITFA